MTKKRKSRKLRECKDCGHQWFSRKTPKQCPTPLGCGSRNWKSGSQPQRKQAQAVVEERAFA